MNIEIVISTGVFILAFSFILVYSIQKFSNIFFETPKLREVLFEIQRTFLLKGAEYSIIGEIYEIPILIKENKGLSRENEPIEVSLSLDESCIKDIYNKSYRLHHWKLFNN